MKPNSIFSIYSSKDICRNIQSKEVMIPNIHLDFNVANKNLSLKKLLSDRKRSGSLQAGDFVIAINHEPEYLYQTDKQSPHLLHFASLDNFMVWIDSYKECTKKEMMPLIAEKKH